MKRVLLCLLAFAVVGLACKMIANELPEDPAQVQVDRVDEANGTVVALSVDAEAVGIPMLAVPAIDIVAPAPAPAAVDAEPSEPHPEALPPPTAKASTAIPLRDTGHASIASTGLLDFPLRC